MAHLHRICLAQTQNDVYGNSLDIEKQFDGEDSDKLERTPRICLKGIEEGIHPSLVTVAYLCFFVLLY